MASRWAYVLVGFVLIAWQSAVVAWGADLPASAARLPSVTRAYLSVAQAAATRAQWQSTALGGLFQLPAMKPFSDELNKLTSARRQAMHRVYGVDLQELIESATRELAIGMIETSQGQITFVFLADAGEQTGVAAALLTKAVARLEAAGGRRTERAIDGHTLMQMVTPQTKREDEDLALFVRDNVLVVGGDTPTVAAVLEHWNEPQTDKLVANETFRYVVRRLDEEARDWTPPVLLFADPIRLAVLRETPRVLPDGSLRPAFPLRHGFDGIRGLGGRLAVAENGHDLFYRVVVHLDEQRERGMNLIDLVEGDNYEPPPWLPDYVNSVAMFHWRIDKIIEHIGPLFDDIAANDEEGAFDEIVQETRDELGVDLHEMFASLGPRVLTTSDLLPEVSLTSQRDLIAIQIQAGRETAVAEALRGMFADDPTAEAIRLPVPSRDGERIATRNEVLWRVGDSGNRPGGGERSFTAAGMMVANGHLLIATNFELLRRLFQPASQLAEPRLAAAGDLHKAFAALEKPHRSAMMFARVHRDFFTTYHLLRAGQLAKAETLYGRAIAMLMEQLEADQDNEAPRIDFDLLPDFHEIEGCFGNTGTCIQVGPDGWFITGFLQPR